MNEYRTLKHHSLMLGITLCELISEHAPMKQDHDIGESSDCTICQKYNNYYDLRKRCEKEVDFMKKQRAYEKENEA